MMPMYMNSSQPGQMRPQGCYYQGFGNYPHHVTMEASSPASCEHWPTPAPYYGSCFHGNPSYTPYWPPCYPPQAPYHTCFTNHPGLLPPAPPCYIHQPFPLGYQHGFESDKDVTGKHQCTKCSPQMCYPKSDSSVVIEEHEPEVEKGDHGGDVKNVRSTNYPYPIIWVPHENARNQERGSHDQPPAQIKAPESTKVQKGDPKSWNGCFPFDENTMKSLMQNQDRSKMQNGKTVELPFDISKLKSLLQGQEGQTQKSKEPGQLQYPIVWIPSQGKGVEASKKKEPSNEGSDLKSFSSGHFNDGQISQGDRGNFDISKLKSLLQGQEEQTQKSKEPVQLQYPIVWIPSQGKQEGVEASKKKEPSNEGSGLKSFSSGRLNEGQISQGDKGNFEGNVLSDAEEKSLMRNIPVKSHLQEPRNIPVKLLENHLPEPTKRTAKTEPAEDTRKEQPSSPPKASRLPPVCLRVDPLQKKKSGGSKSLSSPRRKEQTSTSVETKVASPLCSEKVETSIPEACNVKCEDANKEKKTSEGRPNPTGTEKESVETKSNLKGVNCEVVKPCEAKENKEKPAKKTFTEEEAARLIQSRYRGYDVRRWEPIKKLKEIATVREQMGDVKKRIQALELSADQHTEGKEIVVLGEMVMSLLLKLDSVQGLHPSIREYRKSLARELSHMQDYIDSLKKSSVEREAVGEQMNNTSQTSDCPLNLEHSQLAEENKMVPDSNMEKVCPPPAEEHLTSLKNTTDGQLVAEAEEVIGLSETLATDPEPVAETGICEADSTSIPEKIEAVETVLPINPSSADGNEMTVTNIMEDKVMVEELEEPLPELPQVVETTLGPENATEVSENEDRKEDDYVLPSEKIEAVEAVLPVKSSFADENEMAMSKIDEDKVMVEKLEQQLHELPQVVETTLEDAKEVSETVANASENEDRKGEDDHVLSSEKIEAVEAVLPVNSSSTDGNEMTMSKIDEDKVMVEKSEEQLQELPQVVETTRGPAFEDLEDATKVSETVANASENEDRRKRDDDSVLPSEKDVEVSELPVGVIDDGMQLLSQDSLSCPPGVEKTVVDPEAASKEEPNVDHSYDHSSSIIGKETKVTQVGMSEETKRLMEENQRFKETVEMLVKAGREQLDVVSKLTGRVKNLEKKLSQKKKTHIGRRRTNRGKHATKPMSASYTDDVM